MLDSECLPASVTKEGSSGQSSSINANITTPRPNPTSTNKGFFVEGREEKDSNSKVSTLNCIAHDFEQNCEHLCIYMYNFWEGMVWYYNIWFWLQLTKFSLITCIVVEIFNFKMFFLLLILRSTLPHME